MKKFIPKPTLQSFKNLNQVREYIYKTTHPDFKGDNEIVIFRGCSTIVHINDLTLEELANILLLKIHNSQLKDKENILEHLKTLI